MNETPQQQTSAPRVTVGGAGVNIDAKTAEDVALEGRRGMLKLLGAERLYGLAAMARSRMITERLALKTQNGTLGTPTQEPQDQELAEMQLNLGDQYNIQPPPNQPPAAPSGESLAKQAARILPWMALAGLGAWQLANRPNPTPPPDETPANQDTDTNTLYRLRLSGGKRSQ